MPPIPGSQSTESAAWPAATPIYATGTNRLGTRTKGRKGIATYSLYIPLNKFPTAKTRYARSGPDASPGRAGPAVYRDRRGNLRLLPLRNFDRSFSNPAAAFSRPWDPRTRGDVSLRKRTKLNLSLNFLLVGFREIFFAASFTPLGRLDTSRISRRIERGKIAPVTRKTMISVSRVFSKRTFLATERVANRLGSAARKTRLGEGIRGPESPGTSTRIFPGTVRLFGSLGAVKITASESLPATRRNRRNR